MDDPTTKQAVVETPPEDAPEVEESAEGVDPTEAEVEEEETTEDVEDVEEESEPSVAEPQKLALDPQQLRQLLNKAIQDHEHSKELEASRRALDELYDTDPVEYARQRKAQDETEKMKETLMEQASAEYYENIFKSVLPAWEEDLRALPPEEKAALDPYSDRWTDDGAYLVALTGAVARQQARRLAEEQTTTKVKEIAEKGRKAAEANKDVPPEIAGGEGSGGVRAIDLDPREGLLTALRETLGEGWEDDSD